MLKKKKWLEIPIQLKIIDLGNKHFRRPRPLVICSKSERVREINKFEVRIYLQNFEVPNPSLKLVFGPDTFECDQKGSIELYM